MRAGPGSRTRDPREFYVDARTREVSGSRVVADGPVIQPLPVTTQVQLRARRQPVRERQRNQPRVRGPGIALERLAVELDPDAIDGVPAQAHLKRRWGDADPVEPCATVNHAHCAEAGRHLAARQAGEVAVEERAECVLIRCERRAVITDQVTKRPLRCSQATRGLQVKDQGGPREDDRVLPGAARLVLPGKLPR